MPLFFLPLLAKYGMHLAVVAGLLTAAVMWDRSRINKGVQTERVRVEKEGIKTDAKARTARDTAERDARRLLSKWQRD